MSGNFTFRFLIRKYILDWIILAILIILLILLNQIHPFQRYVNQTILTGLSYPLKPNSVPTYALPFIALGIPILVFAGYSFRIKDKAGFHQSLLGLAFTVILSTLIVDGLKKAVGRPRPDFLFRCFPNGASVFQPNGDVLCSGDPAVIREGFESFPSGHSQWSFSGLGYLSLHLNAKMRVFHGHGVTGKVALTFLPLAAATIIGVTRVDDYWHFWTDVVTGAVIGLVTAYFCYRQHFPPLTDRNCDLPYIVIDPTILLPGGSPPLMSDRDDVEVGHVVRRPLTELAVPSIRRQNSSGMGSSPVPAKRASELQSEVETASLSENSQSTSVVQNLRPVEDVVLGAGYRHLEKSLYKESSASLKSSRSDSNNT